MPSRRDGKSESRLDGIDRDDFQKAKLIRDFNDGDDNPRRDASRAFLCLRETHFWGSNSSTIG